MLHKLLDQIKVEQVDDVPLLLAQLKTMRVAALLDEHFATPSNWTGELTLGEVVCVWLAFMLSQGDHRLNQVEPWAQQRLCLLSACLGKPVRALDFQDDRLADILGYLSDPRLWADFEMSLNQGTLRVYDLPVGCSRIDTTTTFSFREKDDDPDALFKLGHSKDRRPDLPQIKIPVAVLDPLGMPLVCHVVPGNAADDPLYVPVIVKVQATLGVAGHTFFGDCKMDAAATRAHVVSTGDFYVCPLSAKQVKDAELDGLLDNAFSGQKTLIEVFQPQPEETDEQTDSVPSQRTPPKVIAFGYEELVTQTATLDGEEVTWQERRFVVCSVAHQQQQQAKLQQRVKQALNDLENLNVRKRGKKVLDAPQLRQAIDRILSKYGVKELIEVEVRTTKTEVVKRKYKNEQPRVEVQVKHEVKATLNDKALEEKLRRCGWRVYATNHPDLSLQEVVLGYRGQYVVENGFSRFKSGLNLQPLYLQKEDRICGLVHLLSIALRVLTLIEFVVRRALAATKETLAGIYAGQGGRKTARPSAELLLRAFRGVKMKGVEWPGGGARALEALNATQRRILQLLGMPEDLYSRLAQSCGAAEAGLESP